MIGRLRGRAIKALFIYSPINNNMDNGVSASAVWPCTPIGLELPFGF